MIKIISGKYKGRILSTPKNIRPILSSIKKSVFDILTPYLSGSIFLDLYAGSGAVGLEALSRGAKFCVFVEKDKNCLKVISKNIISLNCQNECYVIKADIIKELIWLEKAKKVLKEKFNKETFDIIFIGAPYVEKKSSKNFLLTNFATKTVEIIFNSNILNKDGLLIVQHIKKEKLQDYNKFCIREKTYGETVVSFFKGLLTS
ncbi:MAG: 16S rRNA (guanine(966)-N(2))-methyltransferase RsmD [Elusimicrobiota bacterium]|nr:16S rRNA (guanine(966)-N(2))-methyltransferase RsmD [Endomicrobiia bacterium]MDW8165002.1 16S rRNA (guanine(966)-N(2))-methyltransferase RsmD [Elusimicrobiota bacterium]